MPTRLRFAGIAIGGIAILGSTAGAVLLNPLSAQPATNIPAAFDKIDREEADMLARARAERDALQARSADAALSSNPPQAPHESDDAGDDVRRKALDVEVRQRLQEAERQAELDHLSESIRRAERSRKGLDPNAPPDAPVADAPTPNAQPPYSANGSTEHGVESPAARATFLLVMEPGRTGIRRFNMTADPILCTLETCYISRGADRDALAVPRRRALGMSNTLGRRAGACSASLDCVFRNVDLGSGAIEVQPIDMRILRHDRRQPLRVYADASCNLLDGRLVWADTARGPTWRVWVVPERIARQAGGQGLQAAIDSGLQTGLGASNPPR